MQLVDCTGRLPARSRRSDRSHARNRPTGPVEALLVVMCSALIAGCSSSNRAPTQSWATQTDRVSMFPPSKVQVPASPRVADGHRVPRGGGHYKLGNPYKVAGRWYVPREEPGFDKVGLGSWYGDDFHGRKTANGEIFNMNAMTAAHPTLPLPSYAYVTNLANGRTVMVRVNDRGPYSGERIIDLSHGVARALDFEHKGLTRVRVRYAGRAPLNGDDTHERQFLARQPWAQGLNRLAARDGDNVTTGALRN